LTVPTELLYYYKKSATDMSLLLRRNVMSLRKETTKCDQNQTQELTPLAGEENPRGVEKPEGFFRLGGAPSDPIAAEKPGGFFSGPSSGGEGGAGFQPAQNNDLEAMRQAGSLPHEECEELLEKLAAPVPWKKGGRPTVLTPKVREEICKLLSVGLSRRQVGAYLKIDPTTITHAAERDAEFAREIQQAEDLVQVPPWFPSSPPAARTGGRPSRS
jgi:hypothetical protein